MAMTGKYVFNGVLGSSEVFAFSWGFTSATWNTPDQAVGAAAVWIARVMTVNGMINAYAPHVTFNSVRCVKLNASGGTDSAVTLGITPLVGGSTSDPNSLPFEVSPCVTLRTAVQSRRGRGRFYLPPPVRSQVGGQGVFVGLFAGTGTTGAAGNIAEAFNNFKTNNPAVPVVISKVGGTVVTNPVTSVDVGNVPDSQRRRRNRLTEVRVSANVNP